MEQTSAARPEVEAELDRLEAALGEAGGDAELRRRAAQVAEHAGDSQRAERHWRACAESDPNDLDAADASVRLLCARAAHHEAMRVLERVVGASSRLNAVADLVLRHASALVDGGRVAELAGLSLKLLTDTELEQNQQRELIGLIALAIEKDGRTVDGEALGDALFLLAVDDVDASFVRLAAAYARSGVTDQAFGLARWVLRRFPQAPQTFGWLAENLAEAAGNAELLGLLQLAAEALNRPAAWSTLARVAERFDDKVVLELACQRLWRRRSKDCEQAAARLRELYREGRRWDAYRRLLADALLRANHPAKRLTLLREQLRLYVDELADLEAAAATGEQILQLDPGDRESAELRLRWFEQSGDRSALLRELRRRRRQVTDERERQALQHRQLLLELALERFADAAETLRTLDASNAQASECLEQIWAVRPAEQAVPLFVRRLSFERLLAAGRPITGQWVDRALALMADYELADDFVAARQLIASLATRAQADPRLVEAHRERRERDQQQEDDLSPLAQRLEKICAMSLDADEQVQRFCQAIQVERRRGPLAAERDFCERAVLLFSRAGNRWLDLLLSTFDPNEFLDLLGQAIVWAIAREADRRKRAAYCGQLAALLAKAETLPAEAGAFVERALLVCADDLSLLKTAADVYRRRNDQRQLIDVLEMLQSQSADLIAHAEEIARLHIALGEPEEAFRQYRRLLHHDGSRAEALAFCREYLTQSGDKPQLLAVLQEVAAATTDMIDRVECYREIIALSESLGEVEAALDASREIVALVPNDAAAREQLKSLLKRAGAFAELELQLRYDLGRADDAEKRRILLELAELNQTVLDQPLRSLGYLRNAQALNDGPPAPQLLQSLCDCFERLERPRELAEARQRLAGALSDPQRRAEALVAAATLWSEQLNDDDKAIELCRAAEEIAPGFRDARLMIAGLLGRRGDREGQVALLEEQLASEPIGRSRAELLLQCAQLLFSRSQRPRAEQYFVEAICTPTISRQILLKVSDTYRSANSLRQFDGLLQRLIDGGRAFSRLPALDQVSILMEAATVAAESGARERGLDALRRAQLIDPDNRQLLAAQLAISEQLGDFDVAVELRRRLLALAEDRLTVERQTLELAELLSDKLGRAKEAFDLLFALQQTQPSPQLVARLSEYGFAAARWRKLRLLLEKAIDDQLVLPSSHIQHYRLAVAREHLGDDDGAFRAFVKSFSLDPLHLPTLIRLGELCYWRRQWDNSLRITDAVIDKFAAELEPHVLAGHYVRRGLCHLHLAEVQIGRRLLVHIALGPGAVPVTGERGWIDVAETWAASAFEPTLLARVSDGDLAVIRRSMEQAIAHDSEHPLAMQALAAFAASRQDWSAAFALLQRAASSSRLSGAQRGRLLVAAGDVAWHFSGDRILAERLYCQAKESWPESARPDARLRSLRSA
ncbi:MAG: hypothetical protein H6707_01245 [Deltaproteobacteria bacterium]|nr:hypothetical protein [Deltaproteobacteria bacterium]